LRWARARSRTEIAASRSQVHGDRRSQPKGARNDEPTNEREVEPDRPPRRFGPRQAALEHLRRLRFPGRGPLGVRLRHHNDRGGLGGRRGSHALSQPARHARLCWLFVRGLCDSAPADDLEPRPWRLTWIGGEIRSRVSSMPCPIRPITPPFGSSPVGLDEPRCPMLQFAAISI
jgi:hypothetical protein